MTLDRTTPPAIRQLSEFSISLPERRVMKNGMPLNIINAGTEDVVRFDLLIGCGQWHQEQPLQAMFTNRMLREGAGSMTSAADCRETGLLWGLVGTFFIGELWFYYTLLIK